MWKTARVKVLVRIMEIIIANQQCFLIWTVALNKVVFPFFFCQDPPKKTKKTKSERYFLSKVQHFMVTDIKHVVHKSQL